MYTALINTRKTASQDIQPVMNATSHPDVRPLITEPTNAEWMALKALAAGERVHSEPAEGEAELWKESGLGLNPWKGLSLGPTTTVLPQGVDMAMRYRGS